MYDLQSTVGVQELLVNFPAVGFGVQGSDLGFRVQGLEFRV